VVAQVLGVSDWAGTKPLPPEIWMLPYALPFHPGQLLPPGTQLLQVLSLHPSFARFILPSSASYRQLGACN